MNKNLSWKIIFILLLIVVAVWTVYPPSKTLKPGIDLAGGTSLIYEIDTTGLEGAETRGLAGRMITILRRRIDPANIQNLVWRPQGNTRFEIQMPLATGEAREKRQVYETALNRLLNENVTPSAVLRSLTLPEQERQQMFENFAKGSEERMQTLNTLAQAYDELQALRQQSRQLRSELEDMTRRLLDAGIDVNQLQGEIGELIGLTDEEAEERLSKYVKDGQETLPTLQNYVSKYKEWAKVVDQINAPETGKKIAFEEAKRTLDQLNLTQDQIEYALSLPVGSQKRQDILTSLKTTFLDRAEMIDQLVAAFEEYKPYRGRLDDPKDLQRMLKGAGILEFRILPTIENTELTSAEIGDYIEKLTTKGPKYASDARYVWVPIDDPDTWGVQGAVTASFGEKFYVLASNQSNETMLHKTGKKEWKLKKAFPTNDQMGRRAIGFLLDERGGRLFGQLTSDNVNRPLAILLDGAALSAPNINERIGTRGIISGQFSQTEVSDMINKLNAGSLPARLVEQPISVKSIGPSIGADNRDKGIKAGLIGFALVALVMLLYYRTSGAIADVALVLNLLFVMAVMALLNATFTLPGIAGIILTIGMSVDANVLIFERIREEQDKGASLFIAIKNGYQKAFRTILDANLTTFITAAILLWVASEEIKGFAIVLMLGILSSMFTALFVTRVNYDVLREGNMIGDRLKMNLLFKNPSINWMKLRPVFIVISLALIVAGLGVFFTRDEEANSKYDIEFTGGTSVQVNFKEGVEMTRQQVEEQLHQVGREMGVPAIATANVYSVGEGGQQYEITTTATNETIAKITLTEPATPEEVRKKIRKNSTRLTNLQVEQDTDDTMQFTVTTSYPVKARFQQILQETYPKAQVSEPVVQQVVNDAILQAFGDNLTIKQNLQPDISEPKKVTESIVEQFPELSEFIGGVMIEVELGRPASIEQLDRRIKDLKFKPDTRDLNFYPYELLTKTDTQPKKDEEVSSFTYVSISPEAAVRELDEDELATFVQNETDKLLAATQLETSLPRVTQINPSIGAEAKTQALVAIALSLFAIVAYIWVRFGNIRYGVAAIVALVHDVSITLGAVVAATYIAGTPIGKALLIQDFKINLGMIAAFLTIIGYSLNDTIVVFDRIRENKKKGILSAGLITNSINQTISRTLMTSFTTFIVVLIMYIFGGEGLRGFTFAIGLGVLVGTYSSIAIAAPILLVGYDESKETK